MNWLAENKEWLFSGIGATALAGFFAFLLKQKSEKRTTINTHITKTETAVTGTKINVGSVATIVVNNGSPITKTESSPNVIAPTETAPCLKLSVDDIFEDIRNRPPYQRDEAQNHYIGTRIQYSGVLNHLYKHDEEKVSITLAKNERSVVGRVIFMVKISDFPEFKIMKDGHPLSVSGKIQKIEFGDIILEDIQLLGV